MIAPPEATIDPRVKVADLKAVAIAHRAGTIAAVREAAPAASAPLCLHAA